MVRRFRPPRLARIHDPAVTAGGFLLLAGLAVGQAPPWQFVDVAGSSGIDFRHTFGDDQFSCILEDTGSGVALIDYDGDGRLDLFLSSGHWLDGISDPAFKTKEAGGVK